MKSSCSQPPDSKPSQCLPDERPMLDERLPGLLLDALTPVAAAIASAATGMDYREARQAMAMGAEEKLQLSQALEQVAAKHATFVLAHGPLVEFAAVFSAVNAAHADHLLSLAKQTEGLDTETGSPQACSKREAILVALLVLAPFVIAAIVLIVKGRKQ